MSYPIVSEKIDDDSSPITLEMGQSTGQRWSEITVQVFDDNDRPVNDAEGTAVGQAVKSGTTKPEVFDEDIDLATDDWSWKPELSTVRAFIFSVANLTENYTIQFTVHKWS